MSVNYAAGLSAYDHKGKCGLPEIFDCESDLDEKIQKLAALIRNSTHFVAHTGAGVSTSAGIPDFRGPKGVWTLEKEGKHSKFDTTFDDAAPTFSHMALRALEQAGFLKFLITQNVDGLHVRSGFPRDRLAELHGNVFIEECLSCERQQIREKAVNTVGQRYTGNSCLLKKKSGRICRGRLKDVVLDWEDHLPERDLCLSEKHSRLADLSVCFGTTLQIVPAGNLPLLCKKNSGSFVTINLQPTKHEKKADLAIHARVDEVLRKVLEMLQITPLAYKGVEIVEKSESDSTIRELSSQTPNSDLHKERHLVKRSVEEDVNGDSSATEAKCTKMDENVKAQMENGTISGKSETDIGNCVK